MTRLFFLLLLIAAGNQGCGDSDSSGPTDANYDKVEQGMTVSEVTDLLGPASAQTNIGGDGWWGIRYHWQRDGQQTITIDFRSRSFDGVLCADEKHFGW